MGLGSGLGLGLGLGLGIGWSLAQRAVLPEELLDDIAKAGGDDEDRHVVCARQGPHA